MDWTQRLVSLSGVVEDARLERSASLAAEEPDPARPNHRPGVSARC